MRKILSIVLALALVMSLSATAFAAEPGKIETSGGSASAEVTGTYVEGTTASGTVFSVDIAWSDMAFTYYAEKVAQWDATEHKYTGAKEAYWEGEGTITVTNHSNAKIQAVPVYTADNGYESAVMIFNNEKLNIDSAEVGNVEKVGIIEVTPSGSLPASAAGGKIGTITVTIEQNNDVTVEEARALEDSVMELIHSGVNSTPMNIKLEDLRSVITAYEAGTKTQADLNEAYADLLTIYEQEKANQS